MLYLPLMIFDLFLDLLDLMANSSEAHGQKPSPRKPTVIMLE
ncbi:hypothetical protein [Bradyrhizobium sp. CCBAU 45384]|nr:hypothetical protein [Bradyrhizobium sp. CCBAU 45384]